MTTFRHLLRLPERIDHNLIFTADDRLQLAIALKREDRAAGRNADAWKAYMAAIMDLPAELSRNERATRILDIPMPDGAL